MKILSADEFYDVVNETFPHDVVSKSDILELIDEMTVDGSADGTKNNSSQRYEYRIEVCMTPVVDTQRAYTEVIETDCNGKPLRGR